MKASVRSWLFFWLAVALTIASCSSWAASNEIPIGSVVPPTAVNCNAQHDGNGTHGSCISSAAPACDDWGNGSSATTYDGVWRCNLPNVVMSPILASIQCPAGSGITSGKELLSNTYFPTAYPFPVTCTTTQVTYCPSGQEWNGSACTTPNPCTAGDYAAGTFAKQDYSLAAITCDGTCQVTMFNGVCDSLACTVTGKKTGQTCTGSNMPAGTPPPSPCATGTCPGTVNGVSVCLKCGLPGAPVQYKSLEKTTNSDSSSSTKETTSDLGGPEGPKESTTTTNNPPGGGTPTSSTTEKGKTAEDEKPSEEDKFCAENPTALRCMEAGEPTDGEALTTQQKGSSSITPIAVGGGGACPADVSLPHGATFSWDAACTFAIGINPIVLIIAWIAAGYIVVGAFRE